jgi:hypothetical protein
MNAAPIVSDLLIQRNLELLGQKFTSLWPVEEAPRFHDLLEEMDKATSDAAAFNPSRTSGPCQVERLRKIANSKSPGSADKR